MVVVGTEPEEGERESWRESWTRAKGNFKTWRCSNSNRCSEVRSWNSIRFSAEVKAGLNITKIGQTCSWDSDIWWGCRATYKMLSTANPGREPAPLTWRDAQRSWTTVDCQQPEEVYGFCLWILRSSTWCLKGGVILIFSTGHVWPCSGSSNTVLQNQFIDAGIQVPSWDFELSLHRMKQKWKWDRWYW